MAKTASSIRSCWVVFVIFWMDWFYQVRSFKKRTLVFSQWCICAWTNSKRRIYGTMVDAFCFVKRTLDLDINSIVVALLFLSKVRFLPKKFFWWAHKSRGQMWTAKRSSFPPHSLVKTNETRTATERHNYYYLGMWHGGEHRWHSSPNYYCLPPSLASLV